MLYYFQFGPVVHEEMSLKELLLFLALVAILFELCSFGREQCGEHTGEIILILNQWFRKETVYARCTPHNGQRLITLPQF